MAKYSKNDIIRIVDEEDIEFIRLQFTDTSQQSVKVLRKLQRLGPLADSLL